MEPDLLHWAINFCNTFVMAAFGWFSQLASSIPSLIPFLLSIFFFHTIYRFVLSPLFGNSGSSDEVKKSRKK